MDGSRVVDEIGSRGVEVSCIDLAAEYLARDPNAVEQALLVHVAGSDGPCASCLYRGGRWPCALAVIATRAHRILA